MGSPDDTQVTADAEMRRAREQAQARAKYLVDLLWHIGAFVIVNGFLWLIDAATGGGITWAWYVTIAWGFGLAFHVLAYLIDGRQLRQRKADDYLRRNLP